MIYELDREVIDFLCKKKITFTQFAICLLVYKKDTATIIRMEEEIGRLGDCKIPLGNNVYKSEIDDLIDRDYLVHEKKNKALEYHIDNLIVTTKFLRGFIDEEANMAQEFWNIYPKQININGLAVPSTACDYDEFEVKYLKAIKSSSGVHKEVMSKLRAMVEDNPYAPMTIMNFVGSRHWENLNEQPTRAKTRTY